MQLPVAVIAECCIGVCLGLALMAVRLSGSCLSAAWQQQCLCSAAFLGLPAAACPSLPCGVSPRGVPACRFFYQGKLLDGAGINAVSKGAPFHSKLAFGPMVVWDCQEGRERGGGARGGGSLQNPAEAELAATLVAGMSMRVGVVQAPTTHRGIKCQRACNMYVSATPTHICSVCMGRSCFE